MCCPSVDVCIVMVTRRVVMSQGALLISMVTAAYRSAANVVETPHVTRPMGIVCLAVLKVTMVISVIMVSIVFCDFELAW